MYDTRSDTEKLRSCSAITIISVQCRTSPQWFLTFTVQVGGAAAVKEKCTITALATDFRELDQIVVRFLPLSLQTGGIIHAMPYSKEGNFPRDGARNDR